MDTLTIINLVICTTTSAFTLSMMIIKPFRQWILGIKKDRMQEEEQKRNQVETDKCLLRDRILAAYYKHNNSRKIGRYEFENIEHMYIQYKKLGGNSFVDKIWNEMQTWDVERWEDGK